MSEKSNIKEKIRQNTATVLCLEPEEIDDNKRLSDLGMDSIIGVELINRLNKAFLVNLKKSILYEYPSVNELTLFLTAQVEGKDAPAGKKPVSPPGEENRDLTLPPLTGSAPDNNSHRLKIHLTSPTAKTAAEKSPEKDEAISTLYELEKYFGKLPADLLEKYPDITGLTGYFMEHHREQLIDITGPPASPDDPSGRTGIDIHSEPVSPDPTGKSDDIAIIGISGRYPLAANPEIFWENLKTGKNCITEIPGERWDYRKYYDVDPETPGKVPSKWGGFIQDVDMFDPLFFNISPREAVRMDPQIRLLLESVWNTLEDAGYSRLEINRRQAQRQKVGMFIGCMYQHYPWLAADGHLGALLANSSYWSLVNRCSYFFNFKGPSVAVDSACASSLTAIHMACESIRRGECSMAVSGGINLNLHPSKYLVLKDIGLLGSENKSKSLGHGDGYVPGEGVGTVLLKKLPEAIRDRDHIYALIKGSAVNHGGNTDGFTIPNPGSQADLITEVLEKTQIHPTTIGYIETSATGSPMGDKLEIDGLIEAFRRFTDKTHFCPIGSVKSNIGHLEAAAGISQLTRVLLQIQHKTLVPSLNATPLNPDIHLENSPFYVQEECQEWKRITRDEQGIPREYPLRSAINSFGAGGSNTHLIVEEYIDTPDSPLVPDSQQPQDHPRLIVLSARNQETLTTYTQKILDFLAPANTPAPGEQVNLENLAYTLQVGREAMEVRLGLVANNIRQLVERLADFIQGKSPTERCYQGNVKHLSHTHSRQPLVEGEAGKEFLNIIIKNRELEKLAQLWVQGVDIDWKLLYSGKLPQRISLPTYPFTRKRYWLTPSSLDKEPAAIGLSAVRTGFSGLPGPTAKIAPDEAAESEPSIKENLLRLLSDILELSPPEIEEERRFTELGLDSILGVELVKKLNQTLKVNLKATTLYDYSTVNKLTGYLAREIKTARTGRIPGVKNNGNNENSFPIKQESANVGQTICKGVLIEEVEEIIQVELKDIAVREPADHEVQIQVSASALNFADILCVRGLYPTMPDYPFVAGFQVCGTVTRIGKQVTRHRPGDAVAAMTGFYLGGHAELVNTHEDLAVTKPDHISFTDMCGFPDAFITAYHCLYEVAGIKSGDHVLIQGAAGGVGLMAVQLAKLKNAVVYGTSSSPEKQEYLKHRDVDYTLDYTDPDFYENIRELSRGRGMDIVLNTLSGHAVQEGIRCLAPGGRYLEIAVAGLRTAQQLDLSSMTSNQSFHSIDLRKLWTDFSQVRHYLDIMKNMVEGNTITSIISKTFPAHQVKDALQYIADRKSVGKVALLFPQQETQPSLGQSSLSRPQNRDIAVIGLSGRFPGAKNPEELWNNLVNGVDSVTRLEGERWDTGYNHDPEANTTNNINCQWGGFLKDVDTFDPMFFNITPMEAEYMDPQQRIFLEEAWKAIEDAGYSPKSLSGIKCGVFVGVGPGDYSQNMLSPNNSLNAFSLLGSHNSILTGRISYILDLKGPNMAIDTACSSSLVALHQACQSLLNHESEMALAGGVSVLVTPRLHIMAGKANMLSKDGKCKTFDNDANGFVPGEGAGVVMLKMLDKALQDNDHIYAVIKGSAINQDGQTNGITAPSVESQISLETELFNRFNLHPEHIGYVEAHGTGTKLGDPIEVEALTRTFRTYTRKKQYCAIGSIKTNIGHGLAAAGVSGFIKATLCLYHEKLVPSLHYHRQNEHINFQDSPFYVNTTVKDWKRNREKSRQAAVNSFGFSGTNANIILEEAPLREHQPATNQAPYYIIAFSARTRTSLDAAFENLAGWLEKQHTLVRLEDISYTMAVGRTHFPVRAGLVVTDIHDLKQQLASINDKGIPDRTPVSPGYTGNNGQVAPGKTDPVHPDSVRRLLDQLRSAGQFTADEYKEKLTELAHLYVNGANPDWEELFRDGQYNRISLPTYTFTGQRYWKQILLPQDDRSARQSFPLIDRMDPQKCPQGGVAFKKTLNPADRIVKDHLINDKAVFPGAGYIEMVLEAIEQMKVKQDDAFKITPLVWLNPLTVENDTQDVWVILKSGCNNHAFDFEIQGSNHMDSVTFCKGTIHLDTPIRAEHPGSPSAPTQISIEQVKARCSQHVDKTFIYNRFNDLGIGYGTSFQLLEEVRGNEGEALGYLALPEENGNQPYILVPAVIDSAIQTIASLMVFEKNPKTSTLMVGFMVGEVEQTHSFKLPAYAYATRSNRDQNGFDIKILDRSGRICVELRNIVFREMKTGLEYFIYRPVWKYSPLQSGSPGSSPGAMKRTVLLIYPRQGKKLKEIISSIHADDDVWEIQLGSQSKQLAKQTREINTQDPAALDNCIQGIDQIQVVYFLGGIQPVKSGGNTTIDTIDMDSPDVFAGFQEQGILSLFRLIKALDRHGNTKNDLQLKVITNNVWQVLPGDAINPYFASLPGLTRAIREEYTRVRTSIIDIHLEETDSNPSGQFQCLTELISREPANETEREAAIRKNKRFLRVLHPVSLPPVKTNPFQYKGVYMIIGGAGGIGLEISRQLGETVQARLVLVGRSPLNPLQEEKISRIRETGGEVLYLQADVTDYPALQRVVAEAKKRFGHINGVIHSATYTQHKIIGNMEETDFCQGLAAKVMGSFILNRVFQDEPLDFMMFFSSAQSFISRRGTGSYMAGNTFEDSFALYLDQYKSYPVKVINWGYWGRVGSGDNDALVKQFLARGVKVITQEQGMDILKRTLASPVPQVIPFKAGPDLLKEMGVDSSYHLEIYPPELPSMMEPIFTQLQCQQSWRTPQVNEAANLEPAFKALEGFIHQLLLKAFQEMGVFINPFESYNRDQLKNRLNIIPEYYDLLAALIDMLKRAGFITITGSEIKTGQDVDGISQNGPGWLEAEKKRLIETFPGISPHVRLTWACLQALPWVLTGEKSHMEVLFPGGSKELVENVYRSNLVADYYNNLLNQAIACYVRQRLQQAPQAVVSILEVGAGTGGSTAAILESLKAYADRVQFFYTDISVGFINYGKKTYGDNFPFVEFKVLDIEKDPVEQGFTPGSLDLVFASNVIHATRTITDTLSHIKRLLKTNGLLVVNEGTRAHDFGTVTFGLTSGWWSFRDKGIRLNRSPLLNVETWKWILEANGFRGNFAIGLPDTTVDENFQHVFLGESDGYVLVNQSPPPAGETIRKMEVARPGAVTDAGTEIPDQPDLPASQGEDISLEELQEKICDYIKDVFSEVIKIDRSFIDLHSTFEKYGVDSLVGMEIIKRFEKDLGTLDATLLFEYNTVEALKDYLIKNHPEQLQVNFFKEKTPAGESFPGFSTDDRIASPDLAGIYNRNPSQGLPVENLQDIAIIGTSCRYPFADNLEEFWENLKNGRDCIQEIPGSRWDYRRFQHQDPGPGEEGKISCKWGGFINDVDKFDPLFFNIPPLEAERMDPQERLVLEGAWTALEDAGYTRKELDELVNNGNKARVGVFVGSTTYSYQLLGFNTTGPGHTAIDLPDSSPWTIANRISYFFNFQGPSMPVDTACSSSLTALHLACESLKRGECHLALAGGINLYLHPSKYYIMSRNGILSPTGRCRSFGKGADGIVPGEGMGIVVLKAKDQALRDGDHIYAVIKASSINHGGKTSGYSVPNPNAQASLVQEVLEKAGINPRTISYIEAHGTGTDLGDPIEIKGLTKTFRQYTNDRQFCAIGSVKSNIGHLESAAGMAGIMKILLQMKHKFLVPTLHATELNPKINFSDSPFYVQQQPGPWEKPVIIEHGNEYTYPRRAGVSSFGAGGANAHVILEEAPPGKDIVSWAVAPGSGQRINGRLPQLETRNLPGDTSPEESYPYVFLFSAKNEERLRIYTEKIRHFLETSSTSLRDIAYTLQVGREAMEARLAIVARDRYQLIDILGQYIENQDNIPDLYQGNTREHKHVSGTITGSHSIDTGEIIRDGISQRNSAGLAEAWVQGMEIDWKLFYTGHSPNRISLPTYPFAREHYWIIPVEKEMTESTPDKQLAGEQEPQAEDDDEQLLKILIGVKNGELDVLIADQMIEKNIYP